MNREKRILLNSIAVSFVVAMLLFVILIAFAPDSTPYSINNYGWNGLQQVNGRYSLHGINSISGATPSNRSILLEVAPSTQFSNASSQAARRFIESGGTLIIADSSGFSNSLLEGIGGHILVSGNVVYDSVYNWKQKTVPLALISSNDQYSFVRSVSTLALSGASSLIIRRSDVVAIASSSSQSRTTNSSTNAIISNGPFVEVATEHIGSGKLIVIADSSFFLNSVWTSANNQVLINNLLSNSTVYLDTSSWPLNSQTTIKAEFHSLYSFLSLMPYRYIFALSFVGIGFLAFQAFTSISSVGTQAPKREASTFNSEILQRVREDREKYGTTSKS